MKHLVPDILIFSVYKKENCAAINYNKHIETTRILTKSNIRYKTVAGVYNGETEFSFLVSSKHEPLVKELCRQNAQECYLRRFSDNSSYLVYPNKSLYVGQFKRVSSAVDNYTVDLDTDFIYQAI